MNHLLNNSQSHSFVRLRFERQGYRSWFRFSMTRVLMIGPYPTLAGK